MKYSKIVLMPIKVSYGDYCWDSDRICEHFDNEGGHQKCDLGFYPLKYDKEGRVPKPESCKCLKNVRLVGHNWID